MSRAFVKEPEAGLDELDAGDEDESVAEPAPTGPRYITAAGFMKLKTEFDHLWRDERPRVTREVEAAAALGDRSENAEYIYGKRRLREIDRRLRFLKKRLETLRVVERAPEHDGKVFFGAYVSTTDEDGAQAVYRLVGADEIDLSQRWISIDSPVGKALLGKSVGDVVLVKRPRGEVELEITAIRYEPPSS